MDGESASRLRFIALATATALVGTLAVGCGGGDQTSTGSSGGASGPESLKTFLAAEFKAADTNGDGSLDRQEAQEAMRQDFRSSDLNGDGVLTIADVQQELDRTKGGKAERPLSSYLPYDANGDGRITEQEYVAVLSRRLFAPMDQNSDGKVSLQEMVAFYGSKPSERRTR